MEPVTYFLGYGTLMATFAYYVLTKQEYLYPSAHHREYLMTMHREARKKGLDVMRYNKLYDEISRTEKDIARLRDPLQLCLAVQHITRTPFNNASGPFK